MKKYKVNKKRFKKRMTQLAIALIVLVLFFSSIGKLKSLIFAKDTKNNIVSSNPNFTGKSRKLERVKLEKERLKMEPVVNAKKDTIKKYGIDPMEIQERIDNFRFSNDGEKWVFLTFDDGPSNNVTPKILETLKKHDVKATFFIPGVSLRADGADEVLKRVYEEGHAIGNHSYTHQYGKLYPGGSVNIDEFIKEFNQTQDLLKEILGEHFETSIIRAPGGTISWGNMAALKKELNKKGIASINWNAVNDDGTASGLSTEHLYNAAVNTSEGKDIVVLLMHDSEAKMTTAEYLDEIIKYYKDNGYEFKVLGEIEEVKEI